MAIELTRSARMTVLMFALAMGAHQASAAPERTLLATSPKPIADFELTSHEGKPIKLSQLRGAPALVFFGFTHCPTVCPAALQRLRQLEREHKSNLGKTRIVIISVDGERDTPHAMKTWLAPISKEFLGLTGSPATVRNITQQFSAAFYKSPGANANEYLVEHNSQIFLLDAKGRLHATFFDAPVATMAEVVKNVR